MRPILVLLAAATLGCGGNSTTPTGPSTPSTPTPTNFAGVYSLVLEASVSCGSSLNGESAQRVYTATVTQNGSNVAVNLSAATGGTSQEYSTGNFGAQATSGSVSGTHLMLVVYIAELIKNSIFNIQETTGTVDLTFYNATNFAGKLNGVMSNSARGRSCNAADHSIDFRKK